MKEIKYNSGGQPFYIEDDELQQSELFKAIENQYADTGGVVLSGCNVSGANISAGLVYLDGKIRELAAATGLTFPCYIKASAVIENDTRPHLEDSLSKTTKREFNAEITTILPAVGDFITVRANGVEKRLHYVVRNQDTNEFNVTGFGLNAGKVSYVAAQRTTRQTLSVGGNFVGFTSEIDDLNEFLPANGEFTAQRAGIYSFHFSGRLDLEVTTGGFEFAFQFFNGTAWVNIAASVRNIAFIQGSETVSCVRKLAAGQRVRLIVFAVGSGFGPLQYAYLSIARIG